MVLSKTIINGSGESFQESCQFEDESKTNYLKLKVVQLEDDAWSNDEEQDICSLREKYEEEEVREEKQKSSIALNEVILKPGPGQTMYEGFCNMVDGESWDIAIEEGSRIRFSAYLKEMADQRAAEAERKAEQEKRKARGLDYNVLVTKLNTLVDTSQSEYSSRPEQLL